MTGEFVLIFVDEGDGLEWARRDSLTACPSIKPSVNWSNIEKKEVRVTDQFTLGFNDG